MPLNPLICDLRKKCWLQGSFYLLPHVEVELYSIESSLNGFGQSAVSLLGLNHCYVPCTHLPFVKRFWHCLCSSLNSFSISVNLCKFSFLTSRFAASAISSVIWFILLIIEAAVFLTVISFLPHFLIQTFSLSLQSQQVMPQVSQWHCPNFFKISGGLSGPASPLCWPKKSVWLTDW